MNIIQKVVKKVREYMDTADQERQDQEKLDKWKHRLTNAISEHDTFRANCAVWDAQYNSTRAVGGNISNRVPMSARTEDVRNDVYGTKDARQVVNLTFQLIESQIDVSVPKPNVEPCEFDYDNEETELARNDMIEGMLTYTVDRPSTERIVSENERITKKNSMSIYHVKYNPNFKAHKYIGTIDISNPHPANLIPQPGVFRVKDMDYLFHIENRTIDYVCRTYGEEWREKIEDGTEYPNIDNLSEVVSEATTRDNGKVSVVECWYKDRDGDVCLLTWINDVIIRDIPKFFYKRDEQGNLIEFDEIEMQTADEMEEAVTEVVRVPVHVPKQFPFVIQYNVPKEKSYYGKADPDIIYDQQEAIKKVMSIHEEKLIKGQTKILVRKGANLTNKFNDVTLQIIETEDPNGDAKAFDMKTPDNSLLEYMNIVTQAAKDALGVTEASQGRVDMSATGGKADLSGRALEILSQNTQGRLGVKAFEKNIAFTELYRLVFDFVLAFYDDRRPYRIDGDDGKPMYGFFDKSMLIKQDDAGEWYYPEYDIHISVDAGLPKDKNFIMQAANNSGDRMDNIAYWQVMESIGFPNAASILKREQEKESMMQQQEEAMRQAEEMAAQQKAEQEQIAAQTQADSNGQVNAKLDAIIEGLGGVA